MKKLIGKIHLWLGLSSGLVVFIVSITGAIWCFEDELQDFFLTYRTVEVLNKPILPPSDLITAATPYFSDVEPVYFEYGGTNRATSLHYWGDGKHLVAYLNPYTAEVLHFTADKTFFDVILEIHMNLMLGEVGHQIVAYGTLIFVVMLITGIVLWWPKNKSAKKQRFWFRWKPTTKWKRKNYDIHNILGFYSLFVVIFIALTGLAWSFQWMDRALQFAVSGGGEYYQWEAVKSTSNEDVPPTQDLIDQVFYSTIEHYNAPFARLTIFMAQDTESAITSNILPSLKTWYDATTYYHDQRTGEVLKQSSVYTKSVGEITSSLYYDVHIGRIAGLTGQVIAFFASLFSASLPITGVLIWWGRRRKKRAGGSMNQKELSVEKVRKPKRIYSRSKASSSANLP